MKIHQTSTQIGEGRWKWSISLQASDQHLDEIEKVVYHLHPTFPNPIIEKTNRNENFVLHSSGWGTFVVRIEIHYKNKSVEEIRHRLVFQRDKPKVFLSRASGTEKDEVLNTLKNEASRLGWDVATVDDIAPGDDFESAIGKEIDTSQLFVLLGGDTPSRFALQELQTAKQLGKKALVLDTNNLYSLEDNQKVTSSEDLVNAFKAFSFKLKGV